MNYCPYQDLTPDIRSNIVLCLWEFPRALSLGVPSCKGIYLTVYPSSRHNTDTELGQLYWEYIFQYWPIRGLLRGSSKDSIGNTLCLEGCISIVFFCISLEGNWECTLKSTKLYDGLLNWPIPWATRSSGELYIVLCTIL